MAPTAPSPPLLSAVKGIAIAASFITTGSLTALSGASLPGIIESTKDDTYSAQGAAQQFAIGYRFGRATQLPAELLSTVIYSYLAYTYHQTGRSLQWKLFAGAALATFSVMPYTVSLMDSASTKLVQLAAAPPHNPSTQPSLEHKGENQKGMLAPPGQSSILREAMTPVEEFEPYEDSPFSTDEYERMKVQKMLKQWNARNWGRVFGPLVAGVLGLWAVLE